MSKLDIINTEIERREQSIVNFEKAEVDLIAAIEQFNELDEFYRDQEKDSRDILEYTYKENRHFTGEWPIVYSFTEVEKRPYFKATDAECNPYYPITKVQDGSFDGVSPFEALTSRTGAYQRQRTHSETEDVPRIPALAALQAFPKYDGPIGDPETGEWLPSNWPAAPASIPGFCTPTATPDTEAQCSIEGGTWTPPSSVVDPVWVAAETATALLRTSLDAWRADLITIIADINNSPSEVAYWQGIVDDIDIVLPAIQVDPIFIRATGNSDPLAWGRTPDFTGGSAEDLARNRLITAADTGIPTHVAARKAKLDSDAATEEQIFFGLIKLRLHQANGSYSKLVTAKSQQNQTAQLIEDSQSAIASLNLMKVKNS